MSEEYAQFITRIKQKLGIDLTYYKEAQMKRRLTSLREKRGYRDFFTYYSALIQNNNLMDEFVDRITINVSEFYRNPKRWDVLKNDVIPTLVKNKDKLSIWSAACSTGEEPYSISMLMNEYFPSVNTSILASDIDDNVLNKAKQGIYSEQSLKDLPNHLKNKYFTTQNGLYYVDSSIKRKVRFKKHDLLRDNYPNHIDLILCRNVLIYFTDPAKDKIYNNFSSSLSPEGVLFVGSTEQIFNPSQYGLQLLDTFFYQKK
ncbi:CheR family methyltransferase [Ornithinibacillus halophilus]|uniref:protein-glutamate O-methyltransferase n=1 Tax=Ornithinibacillus halophilus TaxID=930117 RepID=A0A1M5CPV9_9BACI|nr:protein-glutamate O-methyltransferase CheR [Ornithinibacillus halophilus]SHF56770.1 chemotaxis protein methyltransferase CheR [Ornithinibacillus halophilus]